MCTLKIIMKSAVFGSLPEAEDDWGQLYIALRMRRKSILLKYETAKRDFEEIYLKTVRCSEMVLCITTLAFNKHGRLTHLSVVNRILFQMR
jgi:hypothetical protein